MGGVLVNDAIKLIRHNSVKVALHERLQRSEPQRKGGDILHASTLTDDNGFCAREFVLLSFLDAKPRYNQVSTSLQFTFDLGNAAQEIISKHLEELLWGTWRCSQCELEVHRSIYPGKCYGCGGGSLTYKEPRFTSPATGVSGGVDMVVNFPGHKKMRVVELKTMEKDGFRALKAPLQKHRTRTNLYLKLIDDEGYGDRIDTTEASIMYADKGFGCKDDGVLREYNIWEGTSPFKEYTIKRDNSGLDTVLKRAMPVAVFRKTGRIPHGICASIEDKRTGSCPVKSECFSGKYPAGLIVK